MIATYQINLAGRTLTTGYVLPNPFFLEVNQEIIIEGSYKLSVRTCQAADAVLNAQETDLNNESLIYLYTPATDNSKSTDTLLTDNFEPILDAMYGAGNWVKL
jgi:hypothetical protein